MIIDPLVSYREISFYCVLVLVVCFFFGAEVAGDERRIEVAGLFKDRAVIIVDGKRHFIKKGEMIYGDIRLISSTNQAAILSIKGVQQRLKMGRRIGGVFKKKVTNEVVIWKSPGGMFLTVGSINGYPVNFLVDTGATKLALNRGDAERYGVVIDGVTRKIMVSTASGYAPAFLVKLDKVRLGGIVLRGVEAIVMGGAHPKRALLGMSFLNRVSFKQSGQSLILTAD